MTYLFTIPAVPPSFNEYNRWPGWKQREEKRRWQHDVFCLVNQKGNKAPRGIERARVRAVIVFSTNRTRDEDNFSVPFFKWTLDALVGAGVLVDDSSEHVHIMPPKLEVGAAWGRGTMTLTKSIVRACLDGDGEMLLRISPEAWGIVRSEAWRCIPTRSELKGVQRTMCGHPVWVDPDAEGWSWWQKMAKEADDGDL